MRTIGKAILLLMTIGAILTLTAMVVSFWTTLGWHGNINSGFVPPLGSRSARLGISPWGGYAIYDGVLHVEYDGGFSLEGYTLGVWEDGIASSVSPFSKDVTDFVESAVPPAQPSWVFTPPEPVIDLAGVRAIYFANGIGDWSMKVAVPLWIPTLLLAVVPFVAFLLGPVRRWHRRKRGRCVCCTYDLTGNESGVCPECGVVV